MKKLFLTFCALSVALTVVACSATGAATTGSVSSAAPSTPSLSVAEFSQPQVAPPVTTPEAQSPVLPKVTEQKEDVMVADAAIYRGTVTSVVSGTPKEGDALNELILTLTQAKGTNFGAPSMTFRITENTRISFKADQLAKLNGLYLEIYYGASMNKAAPDSNAVHDAIGINNLLTADMVNFNGILTEIIYNDQDLNGLAGRLAMTDLKNPDRVIHFNYGTGTQFYLNFKELQPGDKLNVFHSAAMTRSIPPQSAALEVRPYYEQNKAE